MGPNNTTDENIAKAQAEDYDQISPDNSVCKYNIKCHVIIGLLIGFIVAGLFTLGVVFFN